MKRLSPSPAAASRVVGLRLVCFSCVGHGTIRYDTIAYIWELSHLVVLPGWVAIDAKVRCLMREREANICVSMWFYVVDSWWLRSEGDEDDAFFCVDQLWAKCVAMLCSRGGIFKTV